MERAGAGQRPERFGDHQQRRNTGSVVSRSVVDGIAIDGLADSQVIHVGRIDNIFLAKFRIGPREHSDNVRAGNRLMMADNFDARCDRQRKPLRLGCFRVSQNLGP